jgi:hypothetical protein
MDLLGTVVSVCKQYGPGRLPYARRRDVGAGYAMATVAAITTTVFIVATQLVGFFTVTSATMSMTFVGDAGSPSEQLFGMITTVPAGFITGAAVWRVQSLRAWNGVPAGVVAMLLMYPVSQLLWLAFLRPFEPLVIDSTAPVSLSEFLGSLLAVPYYTVLFGIGALGTTPWLTLPLGALGGYIHEQARTANSAPR